MYTQIKSVCYILRNAYCLIENIHLVSCNINIVSFSFSLPLSHANSMLPHLFPFKQMFLFPCQQLMHVGKERSIFHLIFWKF